jgi:small-conductance mechanosensitive channel
MWYFFLVMIVLSGFFFIIGYNTKTRLWVQLGALFLMLIGYSVISTGLDLPTGTALMGLII